MKRIPHEYTAQDHLAIAKDFKFNVSTNPEVVAERAANRGRHSNIINDQSFGTIIGARILSQLEFVEEQKTWAELLAGTMLNTSLQMLQRVRRQPNSRRFKLPKIVDQDGHLPSAASFQAATLDQLLGIGLKGLKYEDALVKGTLNDKRTSQLAREIGNASMSVAIFGEKFNEADSEFSIMTQVLEKESQMHRAIKVMTGHIGVNPSLAQLRSESTPLGGYIIHSGELPLGVVSAFRDSVDAVNGTTGY